MPYAISYIATLVTFLIVDAIWISTVMRPIYERNLGSFLLESPRLGSAAAFYAIYIAGIIYFAVTPALSAGSVRVTLMNGALLGFLAYGTYEVTNFATLKGWTWAMVAVDSAWGAALSAVAALVGFYTYRWIAP